MNNKLIRFKCCVANSDLAKSRQANSIGVSLSAGLLVGMHPKVNRCLRLSVGLWFVVLHLDLWRPKDREPDREPVAP